MVFLYVRAKAEASVGKIWESNISFESARQMAQRDNLGETADGILIDQAQVQYELGMAEAARATMLRIAKEYPDASDLAFLHAELGDTSYTKRFIAAHQDQTSNTLLNACFLPKMRAALALFARRPMEAVIALERARLYGKREYSILTQRAAAYMQAGKPTSQRTSIKLSWQRLRGRM